MWAVALLAALMAPPCVSAQVRAVSTDGEATAYLVGDFTKSFDVSYRVAFPGVAGNRSWTTISLLLLGRVPSSASIAVGLARGYPDQRTVSAFTDVRPRNGAPVYRSVPVRASAFGLKLRADAENIAAFVGNRALGTWRRERLS